MTSHTRVSTLHKLSVHMWDNAGSPYIATVITVQLYSSVTKWILFLWLKVTRFTKLGYYLRVYVFMSITGEQN